MQSSNDRAITLSHIHCQSATTGRRHSILKLGQISSGIFLTATGNEQQMQNTRLRDSLYANPFSLAVRIRRKVGNNPLRK